ncbi:MAG TPA: signal peptidase I [Candidatus Cloacimonadota bacterium]|nr:signal peptidase I [Candidatus Cloacimonadota bacterium]
MFKKKIKKIHRKKSTVQEYVEAILFAFVVAFLIKSYIFQNFKIPSSSMEETLLIGDYLVANRLKFFFEEPKQGDIVTFQYPAQAEEPGIPSYDNRYNPPQKRKDYALIIKPIYWDKVNFKFVIHAKKNVVKRVIGVPGDTVEVIDKKVYVNGKEYVTGKEQYIDSHIIPRYSGRLEWDGKSMGSRDNFGPVTVPKDNYFVMGDNRDVSADSRYWGFLDKHEINGTPLFIFFSRGTEPIMDIREYVYGTKARKSVFRWDRIFKLIK